VASSRKHTRAALELWGWTPLATEASGIQICGNFFCRLGSVQIVAMSEVRGHAGWPR